MPSTTPLEVAVLSAFRKAAGEHGFDGTLNESNLKVLGSTGIPVEVLRPIIDSLTVRGLLEFLPSKPHITINIGGVGGPGPWTLNTDDAWRLTARGARASFGEQMADQAGGEVIPAADRFVTLHDNQPEVQAARSAVNELFERVEGANDLFANDEDRLVAIREVRSLREALAAPRQRFGALWQAAQESSVISFIAREAAGGVVGDVAMKALAALAALVAIFG